MAYLKHKLSFVTLLSSVIISASANTIDVYGAGELHPSQRHASPTAGMASNDTALTTGQHIQTSQLHSPWLIAQSYSANAQELIQYIMDVRVHGLNPEAYQLSDILESISTLVKLSSENAKHSGNDSELSAALSSHRADFDHQLSTAFKMLAFDLGRGATEAQEVQQQMFRAAPDVNAREWLNSIANGQITVSHALDSLMPRDQAYHLLTAHMRKLLVELDSGIKRTVVEESVQRAKEFAGHDTQQIKLRLMETGELPTYTEVDDKWDYVTEYALQAFQQRNGIPVSDKADARTRKALNLPLDKEIEEVALSLERWRWMPRELGRTHLLVNIPDYRVILRKDDQTLLSMATVVGKVKHATPTFSRDLKHIVFNPTWTVPKSITNRELIPKERSNPGYLESRNFDIMRVAGNRLVQVSHNDVTDADLQAKRFPYVLQQRSGAGNALGNMKFMMPNPWNIYMHDTQSKKLFSRHDRAYSHGCIRLADPGTMARMLLHEDGYTPLEIEAALAESNEKVVKLRTHIPTHIAYMTLWVDEYGSLNRRADIYNHNKALISALKSGNTLLTILNQVPDISRVGGQEPNGG